MTNLNNNATNGLEIEIKFGLLKHTKASFIAWMNNQTKSVPVTTQLLNTYFETDDNLLRHHDMGLRIRGFNQQYEMTLKAPAQGPSGIAKREEFNIPLAHPKIDINLLPKTIWPSNFNIDTLNDELKPLFSTDFLRTEWLIEYQDKAGEALIEVVLDEGMISTSSFNDPILEVELELKSGSTNALLSFSEQVMQANQLRLTDMPKAARGYRLVKSEAMCDNSDTALASFKFPKHIDNDIPHLNANYLLSLIIYLEESFIRNLYDARSFANEISACINKIKQLLDISYAIHVPLPDSESLINFIHSTEYNRLKMDVMILNATQSS